ncbi:DNA/RNA non-specific endonuclease [Agromyces endophyticus]|uniref:DNA/RNA non-specific endonuclease n=1 Tax=Agromyces sp. H17E-10 TaxID=2932244 RepID=UPI001FD4F449|nr:DNA/RNA non-specific endonuclease [Agromyces sp. H17E-10]UOQ90938.1 DNA/RNA non-specific endonuclease [Agromyces sp. H17E-10]
MGFDATFLGVPAPLPRVTGPRAAECVELDYVHFAVVLDSVRRFARVTGVNVDGAALVDLDRGGDRWQLDDRVPADWQAGPLVYADNDFDRGHLVRRRDPVWGERAVAARANSDTFHYTNAAPQASGFNQSKELWLGLEDHVLAYAQATAQRLSVFTAPVLAAGDPEYRGVRVPLRFWKVVAWNAGGAAAGGAAAAATASPALATTAFVVDQAPLVDTSEARPVVGGAPPLGPFRTFQVPVADVAELTGLEMPELIAADVLPPTAVAAGWRRLESVDEVLLPAV